MAKRDLDTYPSDLRLFVSILFQNEDRLSDGYGYYCELRKTITHIATEMRDAARALPEVEALVEAGERAVQVMIQVRKLTDDENIVSSAERLLAWLSLRAASMALVDALAPYQEASGG